MDSKSLWTLLEAAGLQKMVQRNTNIMACCPHPHHDESRPSWGISINPPHRFGCFACGFRGSLYTLLLMLGYDKENAAVLAEHDSRPNDERVAGWSLAKPTAVIDFDQRHELELSYFSCRRDIQLAYYMQERQQSYEIVRLGDLRYDFVRKAVVIPWRDPQGELVALVRRHLVEKHRYEFSEGAQKAEWLYVPRYPAPRQVIVLTEGEFDALQCCMAGYCGVALGNAVRLSGVRVNRLKALDPAEVVLAFDSDPAGRKLTMAVGRQLLPWGRRLTTIHWPESDNKQDPAACSVEQLTTLVQQRALFAGRVLSL